MEIFGIGPGELLIILLLALIFIGPGKMPEVAASIGKAIREFQRASAELSDALNAEIAAAQAEKAAKQLGENGHSVEPAGEAAVVAQASPQELAPVDYVGAEPPTEAADSAGEPALADAGPTTGEAAEAVAVPAAHSPQLNGYTLDPLPQSLLAPSQPESGAALVAPQVAAGGSPVGVSLPAEERKTGDAAAETVPGEAAVETASAADAGEAAGVESALDSAADTPEVERQAVAGGAGQAEV